MQATITYLLTEQAQRAQMAATGQPVARKQQVSVEIRAEDLPLLQVTPEGIPYLDLSVQFPPRAAELKAAGAVVDEHGERGSSYIAFTQEAPDILAVLQAGAAKVAERKAAKLAAEQAENELAHANGEHNRVQAEAAYQRFLADPNARIRVNYQDLRSLVEDVRSPADWWPEKHEGLCAEAQRRNDADARAAKERATQIEQAKQDYIAAWIAQYGDEILRAQFADGLACRKSIISAIANGAFLAVGVPAEAPDSVVCRNSDCPCTDTTVDCLPTPIYERWRELHAKLPEGTTVEFSRVRDCLRDSEDGSWHGMEDEADSASPSYYVAALKMPHGPFTFERRVKL